MNNIIIQKMKDEDIPKVKLIETEQNISILSENSIKEDLKNDNYLYFIAKLDSTIVGYIAISKVLDTVDILSIVTKSEFKNKGIATKLLEHIENISGIKKIFLEVRKSNKIAQSFYEKNGLKKISIRKNYYTDTLEDAYIYEKQVK